MSIKSKRYGVPPAEDDLPPYGDVTEECWGCNKMVDFTELRCKTALCWKCHRIATAPVDPGVAAVQADGGDR